ADMLHFAPAKRTERRAAWSVGIAVAISTLALLGLLAGSVATDRALAQLPRNDALHIRVTGHMWWWEVTYDDADPTRMFATANEMRIPVGRPVVVTLDAADVIHSFWVPSLAGKKDLIPGRISTIELRADQPGEYRGQCAEFCGLQHAFMSFNVFALAPADYEAWAAAQRRPAADPADPLARRGRDLFLSGSCMLCHAIEGTTAGGRRAPDLTHVASRARLAAGRLPNTPADLEQWIRDPQRIKPGVNMPAHPLAEPDLKALVAYLETLR
ncbi:MAG: c-type cytochrome, partial [Bacillota bacterium]